MLEVKYNIADNRILAWNADPLVEGNLKPRVGEAVVVFPNAYPPTIPSDWYKVDLIGKNVVGNPDYKLPVVRVPLVEIDQVKVTIKDHEARLRKDIAGHVR